MPRIVRGQLAQDIGERLADIGRRISKLDQYSGDALANQKIMIKSSITSEMHRLDTLIRSCRAAKNSYPNYPALRRAIAHAGDAVYELKGGIDEAQSALNDGEEPKAAVMFLTIAQTLKLVSFVPNQDGGAQAREA